MGRIQITLYGDFRQIIPVMRSGTRAYIIKARIKKSYFWKEVRHLKLTTAMRVHLHGDREAGVFAEMLINVGNGKKKYCLTARYCHSRRVRKFCYISG